MTNFYAKLTRTATKPTIQEGTYPGEIDSVEVREMNSSYHESGKRTAVSVKVNFTLSNGVQCDLFYAPTLTWSPKGKLMKMLHDLQAVPALGKQLDLDALVGMAVTVKVENVVGDAVTYSNIVEMKKSERDEQGNFKRRKRETLQKLDQQSSLDDNELNSEIENDDIDLDLDIEGIDDIDLDLDIDDMDNEDIDFD